MKSKVAGGQDSSFHSSYRADEHWLDIGSAFPYCRCDRECRHQVTPGPTARDQDPTGLISHGSVRPTARSPVGCSCARVSLRSHCPGVRLTPFAALSVPPHVDSLSV